MFYKKRFHICFQSGLWARAGMVCEARTSANPWASTLGERGKRENKYGIVSVFYYFFICNSL